MINQYWHIITNWSPQFSLNFTFCSTLCGFSPPLYHTELFHCPKISCTSFICSFLLIPLLGTTDIFAIFVFLPFLECHIIEIIQYVTFSCWLLSLSDMRLRLIHVFSWPDSSFYLKKSQNCLDVPQFVYPFKLGILVTSSWGCLLCQSCYKASMCTFCVDINYQLFQVNTKEYATFWIIG